MTTQPDEEESAARDADADSSPDINQTIVQQFALRIQDIGNIFVRAGSNLQEMAQQNADLRIRQHETEDDLTATRKVFAEVQGERNELKDKYQHAASEVERLAESCKSQEQKLAELETERERLWRAVAAFDQRMQEADEKREALERRLKASETERADYCDKVEQLTRYKADLEQASNESAERERTALAQIGEQETRIQMLTGQVSDLEQTNGALNEKQVTLESEIRLVQKQAEEDRGQIDQLTLSKEAQETELAEVSQQLLAMAAKAERQTLFEQLWDQMGLQRRINCAQIFLDKPNSYDTRLGDMRNMLLLCDKAEDLRSNAHDAQTFQVVLSRCLPPPDPGMEGTEAERISRALLADGWKTILSRANVSGIQVLAPQQGEAFDERLHNASNKMTAPSDASVLRCEQVGFILDGILQEKAEVVLGETAQIAGDAPLPPSQDTAADAERKHETWPEWRQILFTSQPLYRDDPEVRRALDTLDLLLQKSRFASLSPEELREPLAAIAPLMTNGYRPDATLGLPKLAFSQGWMAEFTRARPSLIDWLQSLHIYRYHPKVREIVNMALVDIVNAADPAQSVVARTVLAGFYHQQDGKEVPICKAKVEMLPTH